MHSAPTASISADWSDLANSPMRGSASAARVSPMASAPRMAAREAKR